MHPFNRLLTQFALVLSAGVACATQPPRGNPVPPSELAEPAPWSAGPLRLASVPAVYGDVWRVAENRARCALLAPAQGEASLASATPRAATFSGGWAVAYDLPQTRSAFGVAGTGASAWSPDVYQDWPHRLTFADSSRVGYGPEGGAGPNWLAYIQIPGQQCLYNVSSRVSRDHLERLIRQLRFVRE